jgi:predicted GH43/DUF377 family glycosyl hydrolase
MMFTRHPLNPLIEPSQVAPSRPNYEVIGTFNAGVAEYGGETILLLRVAERPQQTDTDTVLCPYLGRDGELVLKRVSRRDPDYDTSDPRVVKARRTGEVFLTSISHVRLARSGDGVRFAVDAQPFIRPQAPFETFGVEDARITTLDGVYSINYTAVSPHGIATALAMTRDFSALERQGVIFPPSNRDVALFPQQIDGMYACYHRPMPGDLGKYNIWLATSPDLIHWGAHRLVLESESDGWESGRVGGGAPPLWTERGWLSIYHAADRQHRYCLGAFLTAHDDPARVIARSAAPILEPQAPYEVGGFFPNVVFTCGALIDDEILRLYYGAGDNTLALAEAPLEAVLSTLQPV